jgi:UDP-galactopyranose mutase
MKPPPLVVFSHLRWDFVLQRPQHVLSRLAATRPVLFVEEPFKAEGLPRWEIRTPAPGVTVFKPYTAVDAPDFADEQLAVLAPMVRQLLADRAAGGYDLWLYTPMALPLVEGLSPRVLVFDKMDDLASFKFAPAGLKERDAELLRRADVVFTGGPSLYRATKDRHPNSHCFASSVDAAHFGKAAGPLPEPASQTNIPHPRLGYFGVIDERFDAPLLEACADARPDWHWVMVGPVVKIDPATLPQRPNIHYLGGQQYADLPGFLSGWDVALMPFARNESTKLISPTQVLEYMAANRPVVSTRITDIVEPYGTIVGLGDEPEEFLAACEAALHEKAHDRDRRTQAFKDVLARTSWDSTAAAMAALIEQAADGRKAKSLVDRVADKASRHAAPVVVIGAGPTGLSAAYHLGDDAVLLEANDAVGG